MMPLYVYAHVCVDTLGETFMSNGCLLNGHVSFDIPTGSPLADDVDIYTMYAKN